MWDTPRRSNSFGNNSQMPDEAAAFKATLESALRSAKQKVQQLVAQEKGMESVH